MWGKIIGFALGWLLTHNLGGAIIGAIIGHFLLDQGGGAGFADAGQVSRIFFETTFTVMGHVAKADGHVSENEIRMARAVMGHMRLSPERVEAAIALFNAGKQVDFDLDAAMQAFLHVGRQRRDLRRMFIEIQLQGALADGRITDAERRVLERVAALLGVSALELRQLEALIIAAQRRYGWSTGGRTASAPPRDGLDDAYAMLGVTSGASDAEVKKAYRRLMNRHHPDKLAAKGLPDDMREVAAEKTREILAAYEQVRAARGMK